MLEVEHIINLYGSKISAYIGAGASNDFMKRDLTRIKIYLENFEYRKNVSYKKVACDLNNYFIIELICAMSREYGNQNFLYCMDDYYNCPIEHVWNEMCLKKWKIKQSSDGRVY